jgi:thiol-disulfide isomerase/thioredoxin
MAGFVEIFSKYITPYLYYGSILLLILIFSLTAYYVYSKYKNNLTNNKFTDVANAGKSEEATVFMFHVNWCPHCKKAMPAWESFKNSYDGNIVNGYKVKCVDIDCTKETSDVTAFVQKYSIESYPTVKMIKGNQVIEFDSKITENTLGKFVETMLNE